MRGRELPFLTHGSGFRGSATIRHSSSHAVVRTSTNLHAMPRRHLIPIIATLAVLGACKEQKTQAADTSAGAVRANAAAVNAMASKGFQMPEARAGHLKLADAEVFFQPCGSTGTPQKLDDGTGGDVIRLLRVGKGPTGGLMALVRLHGDTLVQVRSLSAERTSCKDFPSSATVDASGNEPFWAVRIQGDLATYRTPWNLQGVVYQGGKWTHPDSTSWRFVAQRTGDGPKEIVMEFKEARCMDTMAKSMFPLTVKVTRGDSVDTGCALEGRGSFPGGAQSTSTASSSDSAGARAIARSPLDGTAWRLSELNGEHVLDNVKATLQFERGGKVSGNASCNRFSGTASVAADSMHFGALVSTRMACAEKVMQQERAYLDALANAERYARAGNAMLVHLKGSAKPMRFEPL